MYSKELINSLKDSIESLVKKNIFKSERALTGEQGPVVKLGDREVIMLASNNYLGLTNHPQVKEAAKKILDNYGYGMSSVRFICGTQDLHKKLEEKIATFLDVEDVILFSSCFAANEGFFATLINEPFGREEYKDVVYSDQLNHASIIDALRLVNKKVIEKKIYMHGDVNELAAILEEDKDKDFRFSIIATDGVFSMEGDLAPLPKLVELSEKYNALLFVDDSHGLGATGLNGKGSPEELGVHGKIDVISGTLGKALGGASGGFLAGKKEIIEYLRQKSRPYIFSNSLPPVIVGATLAALDLLIEDNSFITKLRDNTKYFRDRIKELGFTIIEGNHPIVPVMLGEASLTQDMSKKLLDNNIYVVGLWFPVVPEGEARLRVQISASHTKEHLDKALEIFKKVGKELNIIK